MRTTVSDGKLTGSVIPLRIALVNVLLLAACADAPRPKSSTPVRRPEMQFVPAAKFEPSDRETTFDIDSVVIHTTEGTYRDDESFEENQDRINVGTIRYFQSPEDRAVSAHYVVGRRGEITQMVADKDVAWHATYYNKRSIGIECAGWAHRSETWNDENLEALARLVAHLCDRYDVEPVHPEGDAKSMGGRFTRSGLVGHTQIQTPGSPPGEGSGARTDPGPHFPWARFEKRVREILDAAR